MLGILPVGRILIGSPHETRQGVTREDDAGANDDGASVQDSDSDDMDDDLGRDDPSPAEPSVDRLMSVIYKPAFERLRVAISETNAENVDWVTLQSESVLFSELSARLERWDEVRVFDTDEKREKYRQWLGRMPIRHVKLEATLMYRAALEEELETVRAHYEQMVRRCNECHSQNGGWVPVNLKPYLVEE